MKTKVHKGLNDAELIKKYEKGKVDISKPIKKLLSSPKPKK
jgi:hypothetical protein